jgi:radical SAM superfamily enzyme YgiQ (UPF0313 family)
MRLLLINPRFPDSFWSFRWAVDEVLPHLRTVNPPLGLATLAALCPAHWEVTIVDENVEPVPLDPEADIVGVCGMGVQFPRQTELLEYYRGRGHFVVAGGSYGSLCPEEYEALADAVVAGEAEYIWKQFCADFERGAPKRLYHETGTVSLSDSPVPRFDLLKLHRYSNTTLQFSRGCPFRCEFCDIIVMFGRKPRTKAAEQIGRELDELRKLGVRRVFFVDDNLIGHRPLCKELLRYLKEYQERHQYTFSFGTEASLNLAQDRELLNLFREANFSWVFIGIESPDPASLKETLKTQNLHEDILTSVRRIYENGIDVLAGFIIGFDNDTLGTFDLQYRFITDAGIQSAMIGLLTALPKTPLYERIRKEGRLIPDRGMNENTRAATNIVPKNMSYDAMVGAYQELYRRLLSDREIALRIRNKVRYLQAPIYTSGYPTKEKLSILWRLMTKGVLRGGPLRVWHFMASMPWRVPARIPLVVGDWIIALSMRSYAEQHLFPQSENDGALERRVGAVRRALSSYLATGKITLALRPLAVPDLAICVKDAIDRRFFARAAPDLLRLLRHTRARVTLQIEAFHPPQLAPLQALLRRLARYGDRVSIVMDERLRALVPIDSSVFNLVLARPGER